ncbi:MAG: His/Gly/Thr/Pro-type tRNA ligase C-terminal domain-containing protein, partial [Saprospiraceae bacterium]|nr:His/Gly/Thr/Pro-type tRNA ligase C-terminal domain-containing protein [Saprospiraceae bacterium]
TCEAIQKQLSANDIQGFIDDRNETIGKKIRDTEMKKVPFMLIIGEKEVENGTVAVRRQGEGDKGSMPVGEFIEYFKTLL